MHVGGLARGEPGTIYMLIYINDIPLIVKNSQYLQFADDLKNFKAITTTQSAEELKSDVHALERWTMENRPSLNAKSCKVVTYT